MDCQIRKATVDDLPIVYTFELAYIQEIETEAEADWKKCIPLHLKQWIENLPRMFVASQGEEAIGHCFWQAEGADAILASVYIVPSRQRLLERFEEDARTCGFRRLTLGVHKENPALELYIHAGYAFTHTEGRYHYYEKTLSDPVS
jgi:hypothetical protein